MKIVKVVYENGQLVGDISKDTSDRISLVLFGDRKVETKRAARPAPKTLKGNGSKRRWTEVEDDTLRLHYAVTGATKLAKSLGRTANAVTTRAHELGVSHKRNQATPILEKFAPAPDTDTSYLRRCCINEGE